MDRVNKPKHYIKEGMDYECIEILRLILSEDEFKGFLKGNIIKYLFRHEDKNGVEDLKKANRYADWLDGHTRVQRGKH